MNRNRIWICLFLAVVGSNSGLAQKPTADLPTGIFQSGEEYSQFMGNAKAVAYGPNGSPELQAMIPMLNDIVLNRPIGSSASQYNATGTTLGMLSNPEIREELEMVDQQYQDLQRLNTEIQKGMADQLRQLDFSDTENLARQIRQVRDKSQEEINSLLLPHQIARLNQIRMQALLRRQSLVEILTSNPIKDQLEITEDQSQELRDAEREIEADLAKEIAKLREQARDRLLSRLKPDQAVKAKDMIGDAFDFAEPEKQPSAKSKRPAKSSK